MLRLFAVAIALVGLAACGATESCGAPPQLADHMHALADQGETCTDVCYPGGCAFSYSISGQSPGSCDDVGVAFCVCTPPVEE